MVGPAVLAARGVDIAAMVADLAREPEGVIPTEWFVNRRNGLKIGADYLVGLGLFEAAGSRAQGRRLSMRSCLGYPLQPAGNGRGLAYAYRRTPGARAWEPAEGVPTGWGWNTQRGTSRIAADYLLVSLAHGHDPVAGKRNGRPPPLASASRLRQPHPQQHRGLGRPRCPRPLPRFGNAEPRAPEQATSYRLRVASESFKDSFRQAVIGCMLRDPTPWAPTIQKRSTRDHH